MNHRSGSCKWVRNEISFCQDKHFVRGFTSKNAAVVFFRCGYEMCMVCPFVRSIRSLLLSPCLNCSRDMVTVKDERVSTKGARPVPPRSMITNDWIAR